jgi:hypothetical protein
MKWHKYQDLATDPCIGHCLDWHVGPPIGFKTEKEQREWVERKVRNIAVRPWLNLDEHEARGQRGPRLYREWWIHFHIDNDDQHARRLKSTFDLGSTASVFDLMKALKDWHSEWWAKQPGEHPIVIDTVVGHQRVWSSETQLSYESLDIYIPPSYTAAAHIASL